MTFLRDLNTSLKIIEKDMKNVSTPGESVFLSSSGRKK